MARSRRSATCMAVAAILVSGACDGGGSGGPPTVQALASRLRCSELEVVTEPSQRFSDATGDASCQFAGERIQLLTHDSESAQDRALRMFRDFDQIFVAGERWTVRVGSSATATKVKATLGGSIDSRPESAVPKQAVAARR